MLTLDERVQNGIDVLTYSGYDVESVNLDELNMQSIRFCMLGQLAGGVIDGCDDLHILTEEMFDYGFEISFHETDTIDLDYAELTNAWSKAVDTLRRS